MQARFPFFLIFPSRDFGCRSRLAALVAVCLVLLSSGATAQQISPNPNPSGNTITITSDTALNNKPYNDPFLNNSAIDIKSGGVVNNLSSAVLITSGWFDISGELDNSGYFENAAGGILANDGGFLGNRFALENRGVLKNTGGNSIPFGVPQRTTTAQ